MGCGSSSRMFDGIRKGSISSSGERGKITIRQNETGASKLEYDIGSENSGNFGTFAFTGREKSSTESSERKIFDWLVSASTDNPPTATQAEPSGQPPSDIMYLHMDNSKGEVEVAPLRIDPRARPDAKASNAAEGDILKPELQNLFAKRQQRRHSQTLQAVFDTHSTEGFMSNEGLLGAIQELGIANEDYETILLEMDFNHDGSRRIDFNEFLRAVQSKFSRVDVWARSIPWWQLVSDCIAPQKQEDDPLRRIAALADADIDAICHVHSSAFKAVLHEEVRRLRDAFRARDNLNGGMIGKFDTFKASCGTIYDYHNGLAGRVGSPAPKDLLKAMQAEHCIKSGHDHAFTTSNYKITTTPEREWGYVVDRIKCPECEMGYGRTLPDLEECLKLDAARAAGLGREEVICPILYSGPMFEVYNSVLRRHPAELFDAFKENKFPTTIFVLVSAVQKLARSVKIPVGTVLYRGLGGRMELPESLVRADAHGCTGYVEWAFMSTTLKKDVALQYSGVHVKGADPIAIAIEATSVDRGACIKPFSQYPGEEEYLFPPCSLLQLTGEERMECTRELGLPVRVVCMRINANNKTMTVEEILGQKKKLHLESFEYLVEEVRRDLEGCEESFKARITNDLTGHIGFGGRVTFSTFVEAIMKACQSRLQKHRDARVEEYLEDERFRRMVAEMLDVKLMARSKMALYLEDTSLYAVLVQSMSLREAHRQRVARLQRILDSSVCSDADVRRARAAELCRTKGLLAGEVQEVNEEGETRLQEAAAEGWKTADIQLLTMAGADVNARGGGTMPALILAAQGGHTETVRALHALGADVAGHANDGQTAVMAAALRGYTETVHALHALGADVAVGDGKGRTSVMYAAFGGHTETMLAIHALGADLKARTNDGKTAVMAAAAGGHTQTVQALGARGADLAAQDDDGKTAAMYAAEGGHFETVSALQAMLLPA